MLLGRMNMNKPYTIQNICMINMNKEAYDINQYPFPPKMSCWEEVEHEKVLYHLKQEEQHLTRTGLLESQLSTFKNTNVLLVSRDEDLPCEEDCS